MNYSHKVKSVWWASARCASRSVWKMIEPYEFKHNGMQYDYDHAKYFLGKSPPKDQGFDYSHNIGIPEGMQDYYLIMNIRNPYSRAVSLWYTEKWYKTFLGKELKGPAMPFTDWLKGMKIKLNQVITAGVTLDEYEIGLQAKMPDLFIRYENLSEDIKKVPFLDFNDPVVVERYDTYITKNQYINPYGKGVMKRDETNENFTDWRSYYTEEAAELVWKGHQRQFEVFGYDMNSWKLT